MWYLINQALTHAFIAQTEHLPLEPIICKAWDKAAHSDLYTLILGGRRGRTGAQIMGYGICFWNGDLLKETCCKQEPTDVFDTGT